MIFTYSLFIGLCSVISNMTGYPHSYHLTERIHCSVPQRDVLSDKMVLWVVTHSFYFMLCQSYLLSTVISLLFIQRQMVVTHIFIMLSQSSLLSIVISFIYKDKLWFNESMSIILYMENIRKELFYSLSTLNKSANEMFFFYSRIWKSSKNQEDRRLPFLNISSSSRVIRV